MLTSCVVAFQTVSSDKSSLLINSRLKKVYYSQREIVYCLPCDRGFYAILLPFLLHELLKQHSVLKSHVYATKLQLNILSLALFLAKPNLTQDSGLKRGSVVCQSSCFIHPPSNPSTGHSLSVTKQHTSLISLRK